MDSKDHNISITDVKEIIHSCLNYIASDSPRGVGKNIDRNKIALKTEAEIAKSQSESARLARFRGIKF